MKRLTAQTIGIDQGDDILFSDYQDGGDMWTGRGSRERRRLVAFDIPFKSPPVVQCSLSMWDVDHARNMRADISAENITAEGFDLVFRTWGDTRVARARVGWIALGALPNEDDWHIS